MLKEFREFTKRGNVLDLAVALIMGLAFGKIVTSLVNDIIMPPLGLILGQVDFANLFINLSGQAITSVADAKKAGAPVIAYGLFINAIIEFVIVAFVLFLIVRQANRLMSMAGLSAGGHGKEHDDDELKESVKEQLKESSGRGEGRAEAATPESSVDESGAGAPAESE